MLEQIKKTFDTQNAAFLLFIVIAVSLMYNTLTVIQKNYELQRQVDELAQEVALVEVQNQNLKFNIDYYKTDAYLEVEAKRRFNLAEEGERVVLLPKDGDKPILTPDLIEKSQPAKPLYQENFDSWMTFLFGRTN